MRSLFAVVKIDLNVAIFLLTFIILLFYIFLQNRPTSSNQISNRWNYYEFIKLYL